MILSLEPSAVDGGKRLAAVNAIRQTTDENLRGVGLATGLTGVPMMQFETRHARERDPILYKARAAWTTNSPRQTGCRARSETDHIAS